MRACFNLNNADMTAILLGSYVYNAPILADMDALLHIPLVIINDTDSSDRALLEAIGFRYQMVDGSLKKEELITALEMKSSSALIVDLNRIHISRSIKEKEKAEILMGVAESGKWKEITCGIVPLFLCSPSFKIEDVFGSQYMAVEFSEIPGRYIRSRDFVPRAEDLGLIENWIARLNHSSQEERALRASICFAYPKLADQESVYERLQKLAGHILEQNSNKFDGNEIDLQFIADFRDYIFRERTVTAYQLPELKQLPDMDNSIFFTPGLESFYMSQMLFSRICGRSLSKYFGQTLIKKELQRRNILICPSAVTYTSKMSYRNEQNEFIRKSMLRFATQAFDNPWEESISQLCIDEEDEDGVL